MKIPGGFRQLEPFEVGEQFFEAGMLKEIGRGHLFPYEHFDFSGWSAGLPPSDITHLSPEELRDRRVSIGVKWYAVGDEVDSPFSRAIRALSTNQPKKGATV